MRDFYYAKPLTAGLWFFMSAAIFSAHAQRLDSAHAPYNKKRIILVGVATGAAYTGSMIGLGNVWYSQYAHQSFRFFNDLPEWKQMDKFGHFFSGFQLARIGSGTLQWGGLPETRSDKIAALTSMIVMSSIEAFDGFSAAYGASATDLIANAAGNVFFLGQKWGWKEVRIYPKFSWHHTALAKENLNELGTGLQQIIKDYNGQTYWYSIDMDKFIPFPKWLNLSVGYGAQNMVNSRDPQSIQKGYNPYRQYYVGFDFDLTAFRGRSKFLNTVIFFVNMIRIPAPAIEFDKHGVTARGFYF